MGYACPVCEAPQADSEHLANHLAFTALLHGEDHEAWLAEHVPDWEDRQPAELATAVTDDATEVEFPQVFEDTTEGSPPDAGVPDAAPSIQAAADSVVQDILEEARELTRDARERTEPVDADDDADVEAEDG